MTTRDAGTAAGANALPDGPITGGEALARMLLAHGIGPLFGMGGFQLLPFYGLALGSFTEGQGGIMVECSARVVAHVNTRNRLGKVDGRYPH